MVISLCQIFHNIPKWSILDYSLRKDKRTRFTFQKMTSILPALTEKSHNVAETRGTFIRKSYNIRNASFLFEYSRITEGFYSVMLKSENGKKNRTENSVFLSLEKSELTKCYEIDSYYDSASHNQTAQSSNFVYTHTRSFNIYLIVNV